MTPSSLPVHQPGASGGRREVVESYRPLRKRPGPRNQGHFAGLLFLSMALSLQGSCSILDSDSPEIRLMNDSGSSVAYLAWEREASNLFDPAPTIDLSSSDVPVLTPGATRVLRRSEIEGGFQAGDDLRLFLYQVSGDLVELRAVRTVMARELRNANFRVVLDGL